MNVWVDALQEGRADEAVRLFLQEWHDWTPDDVDGRAPLPLSYFGPKVRRRLSFQNTFVIEQHEEGFICGNGRTRFFSGSGVVAYAENDHHGTWFSIGARDPARLSWLKRFEKLPWEDFDL